MTINKSDLVSIIVRTKNEEKWISHCLEMVFAQDYKNFEVIIVDNQSDDHTLQICNRFPIKQYTTISDFVPGKALNLGVKESGGKYLCFISAHCIPKETNWLSTFVRCMEENHNYAGVYGRQLPLRYTNPIDKRDLLYVFGLDKKIQEKDYFFHNANSLIRRDIWNKIPFDENVSNVEDRVWGKEVIKRGYNLVYLPDASVYHHHGLHQGNDLKRAEGVISVIDQVDKTTNKDSLPSSLLPGKANIPAIIPVNNSSQLTSSKKRLLDNAISDLAKSKYINKVFILAESKINFEKHSINIEFIDRKKINNSNILSIEELISLALIEIEAKEEFPQSLIYVNHEYKCRPHNFFDDLICDALLNGNDTVFASLETYDHIWYKNENNIFSQTTHSLKPRDERSPTYRALYGLGTLVSSSFIRKKTFAGGKVSIISLKETKFSERER
tara:strand:+ start:4803 stop:6128 length:1326 start_codon:yes stop_codon:yes gene_type:complete